MKNELLIKELMEKGKLSTPVPLDEKKYIINNTKKSLIELLKKTGRYKPLYSIVLYILFSASKLGISLSIMQSIIIMWALLFFLIAGISSGGYFLGKRLFPAPSAEKPVVKSILIPDPNKQIKEDKKPGKHMRAIKAQKKSLHLSINGEGVDKETLEKIEKDLRNFFLKNKVTSKFGITGAVYIRAGGDKLRLKLKVIDLSDLKSRKVIYIKNKKVNGIAELKSAFFEMSEDALKEIKKTPNHEKL